MKKCIVIILLIACIFYSHAYLKKCIISKKAFAFVSDSAALLLKKKDIVLNDKEDFVFDDYFEILAFHQEPYQYQITADEVLVFFDQKKYEYPYRIREKEVIEIEVPVYQIVYRDIYHETENPSKPQTATAVSVKDEKETKLSVSEEHYLHLHSSSRSYPVNTNIDRIISDLYSSFDSNVAVMIDFSHLNSSACGSYPVYFLYDDKQQEMTVNIG